MALSEQCGAAHKAQLYRPPFRYTDVTFSGSAIWPVADYSAW